jgi:imidazolonepropionase-like amidohydrolase
MNGGRIIYCATLLSVLLLGEAGCSLDYPLAKATATAAPQATLALINGILIDGTGADPVPDAVVLIAGDKILTAGPRAATMIPKNVRKIDVGGAAILPGFINAHVHFGFDKVNL